MHRLDLNLLEAAPGRIPDLIQALYAAGSEVVEAVEKARKISDTLK